MVATHNINFRIEASVFLCLHNIMYILRQGYITISSSQAFQKDRERERRRRGGGGGGGERPREEINSYILWS